MGFRKNDRVEVTNDRYPGPGQSFNGTTGTVTGTGPNNMVAIRPDGQTCTLGFGAEELEHR
jgi:hypothetical protein